MKQSRALAYAAFAVVCIVWGTTYLAIRIAVTAIPPFLLTAPVISSAVWCFSLSRKSMAMPIPALTRRVLVEVALCGVLMV